MTMASETLQTNTLWYAQPNASEWSGSLGTGTDTLLTRLLPYLYNQVRF